jgi:hypothetical protein
MKDVGPLHHFLVVYIQHQVDGLFLTLRQFALDILERAGMVDSKSVLTLVDTHAKVSVGPRWSPLVDDVHPPRHCLRRPTDMLQMHDPQEP